MTGPSATTLSFFVGHHGRDFDNDVGVRLEARHFEIDPDQMVSARHNGDMCLW